MVLQPLLLPHVPVPTPVVSGLVSQGACWLGAHQDDVVGGAATPNPSAAVPAEAWGLAACPTTGQPQLCAGAASGPNVSA